MALTDPDPQLEALYQQMRDAPPGADLTELGGKAYSRYLELIEPRASQNNPYGLPYPSPTDPISQGADAIHALADAAGILRGTVACAASGLTTVTFPVGLFTKPPIVNATCWVAGTVSYAYISAAPTTANFQVRVFTNGGAQIAAQVMWMAAPAP